jgi:hypothetical protein
MLRIFVYFALVQMIIWGTPSTNAAVYRIDLTQPGGVPGTGGTQLIYPSCYCDPQVVFYSPVYLANPGDEFYFGTASIFSYLSGLTPDGGPNQEPLYVTGSVGVSYNAQILPYVNFGYDPIFDPGTHGVVLDFTIPAGSHSIQIELSDYAYTPPIPEPSTWAMMLIGFAVLGFGLYRREPRDGLAGPANMGSAGECQYAQQFRPSFTKQ